MGRVGVHSILWGRGGVFMRGGGRQGLKDGEVI